MNNRREHMLTTITKWHSKQYRGDVPVTVHCQNVADIAHYALTVTNSIDDTVLLDDISISALGHDLVEDTDIPLDYLQQHYGHRVATFIDLLTNHQDDHHTDQYMQQIASAPEEVRIIKYGDLIDNTASVVYNLHQLGLEWGNDFFRPIMERTIEVLRTSEFVKYPEAASLLDSSAHLFADLLRTKLDRGNIDFSIDKIMV